MQAILGCMGDGLVRDNGVLVVFLTVGGSLMEGLGKSSTSHGITVTPKFKSHVDSTYVYIRLFLNLVMYYGQKL